MFSEWNKIYDVCGEYCEEKSKGTKNRGADDAEIWLVKSEEKKLECQKAN